MGLKPVTWAAVAHERMLFISLQPGFGKTVDDDTLRCGSSHREVLLFGLIMSQPCPACGASCSTGARFCSGCGSQLTLAPPPDSRLGFALSQPVGEFCELRCGRSSAIGGKPTASFAAAVLISTTRIRSARVAPAGRVRDGANGSHDSGAAQKQFLARASLPVSALRAALAAERFRAEERRSQTRAKSASAIPRCLPEVICCARAP